MKKFLTIFGVLTALLSTMPAGATVLKAAANVDAIVYTGDTEVSVDLNGPIVANGLETTFTLVGAARPVVISFFAECAISGDSTSWVDITIWVKLKGATTFTPLSPTSSDNAMCTGGTNALDSWVSAVSAAVIPSVTAATHTVKVTVKRGFGTGQIRLDDTLILIQD